MLFSIRFCFLIEIKTKTNYFKMLISFYNYIIKGKKCEPKIMVSFRFPFISHRNQEEEL